MSFIVKSIELSNIRSHDYLFFEPEEQGVTAISGPNGTGKSTIVDSIAWTLFGTKLGGVKNKDAMRDNVEYEKDKFFARIHVEVDGQDVLVERYFVSKTGTVEANAYTGSKIEDSPEEEDEKEDSVVVDAHDDEADKKFIEYNGYYFWRQAGPSVSHAEKYVKNLLKMDEKGFLSSVLVRQKQVDQLISAAAKDRAAVIEDLTGITAVTKALQDTREEYNSLKKAATFSHADEEGIKESEKALSEHSRLLVSYEDKVSRFEDEQRILKEEGKEYSKKVSDAKAGYEKLSALKQKLESAKQRLADKKTDADTLIEERNERKEKLGDMTSADTAKNIIAERDKARKHYDEHRSELSAAESARDSLLNRISSHQESIQRICEDSDLSPKKLVELFSEKQETLSKEVNFLHAEESSFSTQNASMQNAIDVLSQEDGHCPTCLQSVENIDTAVKSLKESIAQNDEKIKSLHEEVSTLRFELTETEKNLGDYREALRMEKEIVSFEEELSAKKDLIEFESGVIRDLKETLQSLESKADSASSIVYQLEEYQKSLQKAQEASRQVNALSLEISDLKEEISKIPNVSKEKLEKAERSLETKRSEYRKIDTKRVEALSEVKVLKEKKKSEENLLRKLREEYDKHKKLMEAVGIASGAVKITEEFRKDLIDRSIPVIENYASDFLSRFTDSKFVRLSMDNKFNASVMLSDGTERSVSALSGGELSAAAIALRMAISMLLGGGGERQSIILDEVLVSMDSDRSDLIMNALKDTAKGQLIFIAHSEESINAIADKTFELKDPHVLIVEEQEENKELSKSS